MIMNPRMAILSHAHTNCVYHVSVLLNGTWDSVTGRPSSARMVASERKPRKQCRCRKADQRPEKALVGGEMRMDRSAGRAHWDSLRYRERMATAILRSTRSVQVAFRFFLRTLTTKHCFHKIPQEHSQGGEEELDPEVLTV